MNNLIDRINLWLKKWGRLTRRTAIRKNCIDCCGGSQKAPRNCQDFICIFYPFRLGRSELPHKERELHQNKNGAFVSIVKRAKILHRKGMVTISETQDKTVIEITKEGR